MKKLIVGLTGGIGSGKTTIANLFAEYHIDIIDADLIARSMVGPDKPAFEQIVTHFGPAIIMPSGELNRLELRKRIFNNEKEKEWLNSLLHPLIRQQIIKQIDQITSNYGLLVVPLLIEGNYQPLCDRILVIDMTLETQIKRTCERDNITSDLAKKIMNAQTSREERFLAATDIINNETTIQRVKQQVALLHEQFLKMATS